jgi:hypothetical protein
MQRIRRTKLLLGVLLLGFVPVTAVIMALFEFLETAWGGRLSSRLLDMLAIPWIIAVPSFAISIGLQRCPRCRCRFSVRGWRPGNPFRMTCAHCGASARKNRI